MKIISIICLLSSLLLLHIQITFAENVKSEDKALLDALQSEADETSMEKDKTLERIVSEPSVVPKAVTDYYKLEQKVAAQIKGLLAESSQQVDAEKDNEDNNSKSNENLKNKLESIVSSELLKGNKLNDIRSAVSAAMVDINKNGTAEHNISSATIESAGKALKSIVAIDKTLATELTKLNIETVTVEAGENLYKIAQRVYGSGKNYLALFEANKDILKNDKDPELKEMAKM
jgi:nucleoid-associated protein YgaU